MTFAEALEQLASRRIILVGGKGGVGKTTIASAIAKHREQTQRTILISTDPSTFDAEALYRRFLEKNLPSFLELGDRGTYLEKDELRRFFELSLPGVDELMAWLRIGELAEENPDAAIIVDTAPTGHTLRMLGSAEHFRQLAAALDAMQEKHRGMVRQFTRRDVRDALDDFIDRFTAESERHRALLTSPQTAFLPVFLDEPWVIEQTKRLIAEVRAVGIEVPLAIVNRGGNAEDVGVAVATYPLTPHPAFGTPLPSGEGLGVRGLRSAPLTFFAGKGGVGKTTLSAATALRLARTQRVTLISVDPAHSVRDVFAREAPPANLTVEIIDTKAQWQSFRENLGREVERAIAAIAPKGMSVAYDAEAMQKLVEIAPPGADEIFAVIRLADLVQSGETVIVDTAPTGHFLRLIDLPKTAGEWVRELMRILLRYKDLVPPGSLGEELVRASRALAALDETMHSDRCTVIVVTRPEPLVVDETRRLIAELTKRGLQVGGVIANYVTDEEVDPGWLVVPRREQPPVKLDELASLLD